jgi:hypothetical protein
MYHPPIDAVREALTTNTVGPISIAAVAKLIDAPVEKLRPLVEHKYLRVLFLREEFEQTIVVCPGQRATDWLRNMFRPLKMRQFIPRREVGKLWKVTENHVLKICRGYKIPVSHDPVFGYLTSFNGLKSYARTRVRFHEPKGTDRASFLKYYLSQIEGVRWKHPLPHRIKLEKEIRRIAIMAEPWRTFRGMAFLEAFRDARTVTECLRREGETYEELLQSESKVAELGRRIVNLPEETSVELGLTPSLLDGPH